MVVSVDILSAEEKAGQKGTRDKFTSVCLKGGKKSLFDHLSGDDVNELVSEGNESFFYFAEEMSVEKLAFAEMEGLLQCF